MPSQRIYLDYNATAPLIPAAAAAMRAAITADVRNPSSIHEHGRAAREWIEDARRAVAAALSAAPAELVLTSGGTEANALGIVGLVRALGTAPAPAAPFTVVTTRVEHPSCTGVITDLARGVLSAGDVAVHILPNDGDGRVDPGALADVTGPGVLVVQLANHELGTVQDVAALAAVARERGLRIHCDAVQAFGKIPVSPAALGVDTLAVSAHKIGGPKGAGALWVRDGVDLEPVAAAGHQERERRGGTENVVGIAGFGAAAAELGERLRAAARVTELTARLQEGLLAVPGARVHGAGAPRTGNTVNVGFAGAAGEVVAQALDLAGISVSTGAACSSGSVAPSPVVLALGLDDVAARAAVRFSLGPETRADEIASALAAVPAVVARAREFS